MARRPRRYGALVSGALVVGLAILAAGCLPLVPPPTTTTTTTTAPYVGTLLQPGQPNPYGPSNKGEFVADCPYSHRATQDPIVAPGNNAFWHQHDFFGNGTTDSNSIPEFLLGQDTSCTPISDGTAYWAPTLSDDTGPVPPASADFFYGVTYPQDPAKVQPLPAGLLMVAGASGATTEQPAYVEQWSCSGSSAGSATIPDCHGAGLVLTLHFPECWDGVHLDSADHKSHMAYAQGKSCPQDHPVLVPQLTFVFTWGTLTGQPKVSSDHTMAGTDVTPGLTAHGDFMDAWNQGAMETLVTKCLRAAVICNAAGTITGN